MTAWRVGQQAVLQQLGWPHDVCITHAYAPIAMTDSVLHLYLVRDRAGLIRCCAAQELQPAKPLASDFAITVPWAACAWRPNLTLPRLQTVLLALRRKLAVR